MGELSEYQKRVIEAICDGEGHIAVNALAGSGKTTTAERALERYLQRWRSRTALYCAFTRRVVDEAMGRFGRLHRLDISTLNGVGHKALLRFLSERGVKPTMDESKLRIVAREILNGQTTRVGLFSRALANLVHFAHMTATPTRDEVGLLGLTRRYSLVEDAELTDAEWALLVGLAADVERESDRLLTAGRWTYDDQISAVVRLGIAPVKRYDLVVVDEAQDLNMAQHQWLKQLVKPGGRLVLIGDIHQAIFQFAGAAPEVFQSYINRADVKALSLPLTYRCPQRVVSLARRYAPEMIARESAPEGDVAVVDYAVLLNEVRAGDYVATPRNAPGVGLALELLGMGRPTRMLGRDIGQGLARLVKMLAERGATFETFRLELQRWREEMIAMLRRRKSVAVERLEQIEDRADSLDALYLGYENSGGTKTLEGLQAYIESLYGDDEAGFVLVGTIHKLKGAEANRVWLLDSLWFKGRLERGQARNMLYVGLTRARHELYIVAPSKRSDPVAYLEELESKHGRRH